MPKEAQLMFYPAVSKYRLYPVYIVTIGWNGIYTIILDKLNSLRT